MKKALLYGNGDFVNLGCEAIARGISEILASIGGYELSMATYSPDVDSNRITAIDAKAVKLKRGRESVDNIIFELLLRAGLKKSAMKIPHSNAKKIAKDIDVTFAVGGDNYCYDGCQRYYRLNKGIRHSDNINVFWGCSIEPSSIDREMIDDLNGYDVIFARETITYEALKKVCNTDVRLCSDPAFRMTPDYSEVPEILNTSSGKWIGVNLSPLVYKYSEDPETVNTAVTEVLQRILDTTDHNIFFFPHVYGDRNDIYINGEVARKLNHDGTRVYCFEKQINASCMKGIISKLDAVICARTHASIAAYSSCVPTFVLGYSVKAKGLAKDIYGNMKSHVMPVQELNDVELFCSQIKAFIERINDERHFLETVMPEYIEKADLNLGDIIDE